MDVYAQIKKDVWNEKPDLLNILFGINSLWYEHFFQNGMDLERWEKVYRRLIEDTKKQLPNTKIILCEPFILHGKIIDLNYKLFATIKQYAQVVKK